MKALILAAGRGSRMYSLTKNRHKSLVSLLQKPILEWQLEALKIAGIEETIAVTGYQKESVLPYFHTYFHNNNWSSTNVAYTLLQADTLLSEQEILVCYSDIVYHPNHIKSLMRSQFPISITYDLWWDRLWEARFDNPLDDAESFKCKRGKLIEIGLKPESMSQIEGQYMGLIKVQPNGWKAMKPFVKPWISLTELLNQLLIHAIPVRAIPIRGKWCEVDRIEDLIVYEKLLSAPKKWLHDFRWMDFPEGSCTICSRKSENSI